MTPSMPSSPIPSKHNKSTTLIESVVDFLIQEDLADRDEFAKRGRFDDWL